MPMPADSPAPTGSATDRSFDALATELAREQLADDPVLGSALGLTEYDELLPDLSATAIRAREAREDGWTARLEALDTGELDAQERIDRDLVLMVLRGRAVMREWADWRRSADTYSGAVLYGVHRLLLHRLRPDDQIAAAIAARLNAAPTLLEQGAANLDQDLADPTLLRRALGQIRAGAAYARAVAGQLPSDEGRAEVESAGQLAAAALDCFAEHVDALAGRATGSWAVGEERYDGLLRAEGLHYGAREMQRRGAAEYDAILTDMRRRTADLRGQGDGEDWRELLAELSADHPATPEQMLADYRGVTDLARQFCIDRDLVTVPEGEQLEVVPSAPFTRSMVAVAHYMQPPPFADRKVGYFFVPYPPADATPEQVQQRLATNSRQGLWPITAHEAYPGHHWHLAWVAAAASSGAGESGPLHSGARLLRTLFASTYFVEGWGLYSEDLMREQGFYRTREQELCQRDMRLFRATRIVVDTALHLGEMSIEQAVEHLCTHTSLSPDTARAEVLRYCATPTQAASYLTGALEIARMRDRWLGEGRGSLRQFHDTAAGSGRLPIRLVERTLFGAGAADE